MSPFTSLVIIPLLFTLVAMVAGVSEKAISVILSLRESPPQPTQGSCCCLRFCTFPLCWMRDCLIQSRKMIYFAKGDPMKVLMATAVVAAAVSLNGDGTTTTLICCSAFIPIYKKLNMKMMNLGVLIILQNTIMNLLPWGGPTARAMAVLEVDADILFLFVARNDFVSALCGILCSSQNGDPRTETFRSYRADER